MNKIFLKIIVVTSLLFTNTNAQSHETIPTSHWIYNSIQNLQVAGWFRSLDQGCYPYTRYQLAKQWIDEYNRQNDESQRPRPSGLVLKKGKNSTAVSIPILQGGALNGGGKISRYSSIEFNRIKSELNKEIHHFLTGTDLNNLSYFRFGLTFTNNLERSEEYKNYLFTRLYGSIVFNNNFTIRYSAYVDQRFKDDPYFIGYEWHGFRGFQEQLYITYSTNKTELKFGRDYVKWGYGKGGRLLLCDTSRPFDMFSLKLKSKRISMQSVIIQLDKMNNAERYLTAIRFELNPIKNLYFGFGQSALYGGENQPIDFTLSNPLAFYSFTQDNDSKSMNGMIYFDGVYYLKNKYKFYGEFLIDDFQVDNEVKGDLEPNELAFILGLEVVDFFDSHAFIEFTQVRNRTYNVPDRRIFEKFLHKNMPIAHPVGTDFQSFQIECDRWLNKHWSYSFGYLLIRKGEGKIRGEFTEPWLDQSVTMESGYKENIPYGVVESKNNFYFGFHYEYNVHIQSDISIGYEYIKNFLHTEGDISRDFYLNLALYFDYNWLVTSI